jgi:hypothetical protein
MSRWTLLPAVPVLLIAAACTEPTETSTATFAATATCACDVPEIVRWEERPGDTATLFPDGIAHLHTALVADDAGAMLAWGIASGEVLWIYRVGERDHSGFLSVLTQAWSERERAGAGRSHSVAGTTSGSVPRPPTPPGQPPFSDAYIRRVLASAQTAEDASNAMLDELDRINAGH